jgi:hypothetical protein
MSKNLFLYPAGFFKPGRIFLNLNLPRLQDAAGIISDRKITGLKFQKTPPKVCILHPK